ncbi:hypothetical protein E4U55_002643 [Claviceps digitariae]|nr:hypothetical protein E4U55_002643 [Claviceps digitariae]
MAAIVHAGPWKHSRRARRLESRQAVDDGFGSGRGFTTLARGGSGGVNRPVGNRQLAKLEIDSQDQEASNRQQIANGQFLPNVRELPARQTETAAGFEGHSLEISAVTVTAACAPTPDLATVTLTQLVTSCGKVENPATVTVTMTQLASTVTQTVTASCATNNPRPFNDALPANQSSENPRQSAQPEPHVAASRLTPVTELPSTITQINSVVVLPSASQQTPGESIDRDQSDNRAPGLAVVIVGDDHGNGKGPKASGYSINSQPTLQTGDQPAIKQCVLGIIRGEPQVTCDDGSTIPIIEGMISTVEDPPTQRQVEVLPMTSTNGNGIDVSIVLIAESALPMATHMVFDSACVPSTVGMQPNPLPSSPLVQEKRPVLPGPPPGAPPDSKVEPAVPFLESSSSSSSSSKLPTTLKTVAKSAGTVKPTKSHPTPTNSSSRSFTSSLPRTAVPSSSTATSAVSVFPSPHLVESLALGRLGPSPTGIKDSTVAPKLSGTVPESGVAAPAQPGSNLSGLSLSSYQDLGSLYNQDQLA